MPFVERVKKLGIIREIRCGSYRQREVEILGSIGINNSSVRRGIPMGIGKDDPNQSPMKTKFKLLSVKLKLNDIDTDVSDSSDSENDSSPDESTKDLKLQKGIVLEMGNFSISVCLFMYNDPDTSEASVVPRDPRFDDMCGTLNKHYFRQAYSFIGNIKVNEKQARYFFTLILNFN
ncbi:hypothetical protein HELRODRAFT_166558 [Helobdella robusta]|uniref:rRNA biogenesis protein RRP36 n=1 Tax=Helobdella robusta TaxID=6412 RepID=T1EY89_HELRO|nr:hypothetical protein HELRODRAFT_166558 [Helobdella robusta]ESO11555.1 hypothetical protein HELRODRAFT_166558 [Helobdella robusta]